MVGRTLDATDEQFVAMQQRDATVLGGGFDGEDVHEAAILPAARRFVALMVFMQKHRGARTGHPTR
ncbi:hypothetical protein MASR2M50_27740 [Thauera sp.]